MNTTEYIDFLEDTVSMFTVFFFLIFAVAIIATIIIVAILLKITKDRERLKTSDAYLSLVVKTQEEEQTRLSRELHDTILQELRFTALQMKNLRDEPLHQEIREQLNTTIKHLHTLCSSLSQENIDIASLSKAIEELCQDIKVRSHLSIKLTIIEGFSDKFLVKNQKLMIFRILQEALCNAERHSKAKEICVLLRPQVSESEREGLYFFINDDGIGFDAEGKSLKGHFGINNMKDRAALIGATLSFNSFIGAGTEVRLFVPKDKTYLEGKK